MQGFGSNRVARRNHFGCVYFFAKVERSLRHPFCAIINLGFDSWRRLRHLLDVLGKGFVREILAGTKLPIEVAQLDAKALEVFLNDSDWPVSRYSPAGYLIGIPLSKQSPVIAKLFG